MKTALCTTLLLATLVSATAAETNTASSVAVVSREARWNEDLDYFARELPARHLDFFKLIPKKTFDREVRDLRRELPHLSDVEVVFRLMRLGARLGVAHTWVGFPPKAPAFHGYPFILHWCFDDLIVCAAAPEYRGIIGARVVKIGTLTSKRAVARVAPYISYENQAWLYKQSPLWLRNAELLRLLEIAQPDGTVHLSLVRPDGTPLSLHIPPLDAAEPKQWIQAYDALGIPPALYRKSNAAYWYEFLPEAQALYLQYNACADTPNYPFTSFARDVFSVADSNAVQRMIVDLRFNGGGNSSVIKPLLSGLKSRPRLQGKDHLYVLIAAGTFSSGVHAAVDLRNEAGGSLIGLPTGGKPNCYGEAPSFPLPNSQMEVHYCTKYFRLSPKADPTSLEPDICVAPSMKDLLAGRDPALEAALGHRLK